MIRKAILATVCVSLAMSACRDNFAPVEWSLHHEQAKEISVSTPNSIYLISAIEVAPYGRPLYHLTENSSWTLIPSNGAVRIIQENSTPWIIDTKKDFYRLVGKKWVKMGEKTRELAFGGG